MKIVGYAILACVLLSLAQPILSALVVISVIAVILGIFCRPAETFGFLAFGLVSYLFQSHPIAAVWIVSLILIAGTVLSGREKDAIKALPLLTEAALPAPKAD